MIDFMGKFLQETYTVLLDSSFYILAGITLAGLLRVVLNPTTVVNHLGRGRYSSVVKAAVFGVPLPL